MGDINFTGAKNGTIQDSNLSVGDISGGDKIANNQGNVAKSGRDLASANVHVYADRNLPVSPDLDAMNTRDLIQIDSQIYRLMNSIDRLSDRIEALEKKMDSEITLMRHQINAPAPKVTFSSDQMRQIFIAIIIATLFFSLVVLYAANGGVLP